VTQAVVFANQLCIALPALTAQIPMASPISSLLLLLAVLPAEASQSPPMLSFYDFDPASQAQELQGLVDFGIDLPIDCLLDGYYAHGIPSLFRLGRFNTTWGDCWPKTSNGSSLLIMHNLPASRIFAEKGLYPDWEQNVKLTVSMLQPLIAAGVIKGVFLGDEQVCGGHQTIEEVSQVAQTLRTLLGPEPILYTNECGCPSYPIPAALSFFSVDIYATGSQEVADVRSCYEKNIFRNLHGSTKAFVVPGIFGDPTKNFTAQEEALVAKVKAYGAWIANEPRIAGLNPWHYSPRQNSRYPHDKYPFGLGVVNFPKVLSALRELKKPRSREAVALV